MKNTTQLDYSQDAQFAISKLEAVHPIFLLEEVKDYAKAKAEYIKATSKPITLTELRLATRKYVAVLGDGHVSLYLQQPNDLSYFNIDWVANGGRLFLLDEEKKPTNIEVVNIGGIPVSKVTAQVDMYYAAENEAARQNNYAMFCRQEDMIRLAGCDYAFPDIKLSTSEGKTMACKFAPMKRQPPGYIVKHEMIDDVFYIDLRMFQPDKTIDDVVEKIKAAIQDGRQKFIIDIRDNPGGNSNVGKQLVEAMGMRTPSYGMFARHNDLVQQQSAFHISKGESTNFEPNKNTAKPNENITLLVLTNVKTFSSATMLGVWTQDGKLGKVVGQTSSNRPNAYGDMLSVDLPISGIKLSISFKRFLRPDTDADPDSLIPDIEVPFGEDILAAALEYMV